MKKYLKTALLALPLAIFGACSSDEPVPAPDNGTAQKSETRYLKVNLVNAGTATGSRAVVGETGDYTNGSETENKIRTIDFFLYDADKNFHSHIPFPLDGEMSPTPATTPEHVEAFFETNLPVSIIQGQKLPSYVVCILNAVQPQFYINKSMAEAQGAILASFYSTEGSYFGMSNSVYFGRDEVTGEDDVLVMATPFNTDKLLTQTELENLKGNPEELAKVTTNIYVERYAAKVSFSVNSGAIATVTSGNGVELAFETGGWDINAYEKSFYFIKSFRDGDGSDTNYTTKTALDDLLFAGWNNPDHYRSFWARSPGYYKDSYPIVADDILDETTYPYNVWYRSFAELNPEGTPSAPASRYVMETTLKGSRLTGEDMGDQYLPLTSIPSVVLTGTYKVNGTKGVTFYTYQNNTNGDPMVYSETEGAIDGTTSILDRLLSSQTVVQRLSNGNYYPVRKTDVGTVSTFFEVAHPTKNVRNNIKIGGDLVTLQFKSTSSGFYYYDADLESYQEITSTNIDKVNRLLYQNLGGAHAYINGRAFFTAPIQHWGWYRKLENGNNQENYGKPIDQWDWTKMKTGDFGIVRNHVYTIEVSKIAGLGTGIINDNDPLLPPTDKVAYSVNFRVNIQKWATLPTQKWEW